MSASRKAAVLIGVSLIVITPIALLLYLAYSLVANFAGVDRTSNPPPAVIVTSTAPDERRKILITETQPQGGMASPYMYRLSLADADGKPFAGQKLEFGNDSAMLSPSAFTIKWENEIAIVDVDGKAAFKLREQGGLQIWERAEVSPELTTKPTSNPVGSTGRSLSEAGH